MVARDWGAEDYGQRREEAGGRGDWEGGGGGGGVLGSVPADYLQV